MTIDVKIKDGKGKGNTACVTPRNQLIVAPLDFSTFYPESLITDNVPVTVVPPQTGKQFVITEIILYANKNVGTSDASVDVYESDDTDSATVLKYIFQTEIPKYGKRTLTGLNVIVSEGVWLNAVTDDNIVFVTIGGYYVDAA